MIRARIEHVFGFVERSLNGFEIECIGKIIEKEMNENEKQSF
jgi:hypothetical protein